MVRGGVVFQPLVKLDNLRGRAAHGLHDRLTITHLIITYRKNGSEYDTDAVRGGELRHRDEVIFDRSESSWTSIAGDIVRARKNDDRLGFEVDHVVAKVDEDGQERDRRPAQVLAVHPREGSGVAEGPVTQASAQNL